ncbi:hypothetical protein MJH12_01930 [bacterium]|nr:hypothetical protein [bacterium]
MKAYQLKIFTAFLLLSRSYSYSDLDYLLVRAHGFEKQNNLKKAMSLYQEVINSSASSKQKEFASQKLKDLKHPDQLEADFFNYVSLVNSDCMILSIEKSLDLEWNGNCENGLASGRGQLFQTAKDKEKFIVFDGRMKNGKKDSYGITYRMDKSVIFMGIYQDNLYHGEGKLHYKTGDIAYAGFFEQGRKTGQSKSFRPNGAMLYIGQYQDNEFHGEGISYFEDGETYHGGMENSYRHGYGVFTKLEGVTWDGNFQQGGFSGRWKMQIPQGDGAKHWVFGASYQGGWKDQKRHFKGTLVWPSGKIYSGDWNEDLRHGTGSLTFEDESSFSGSFEEDLIVGKGELKLPSGASYQGDFKENVFHGQGTWSTANGISIEGQWNHGVLAESVDVTALLTSQIVELESAAKFLVETNESGLILTQNNSD